MLAETGPTTSSQRALEVRSTGPVLLSELADDVEERGEGDPGVLADSQSNED